MGPALFKKCTFEKMLPLNSWNTRTMQEICSKLTITTPELLHQHIGPVFWLLTLNKYNLLPW